MAPGRTPRVPHDPVILAVATSGLVVFVGAILGTAVAHQKNSVVNLLTLIAAM